MRGSQVTIEEAVQVQGRVPAGQQSDAVLHPAEPDSPAFRRRGSQLGYGFTVARNNDGSAFLNRADEFGEAIFGFGNADIHGLKV